MTKSYLYSTPSSWDKGFKGETSSPLKMWVEVHRKVAIREETFKPGKADHIWKEKGGGFL